MWPRGPEWFGRWGQAGVAARVTRFPSLWNPVRRGHRLFATQVSPSRVTVGDPGCTCTNETRTETTVTAAIADVARVDLARRSSRLSLDMHGHRSAAWGRTERRDRAPTATPGPPDRRSQLRAHPALEAEKSCLGSGGGYRLSDVTPGKPSSSVQRSPRPVCVEARRVDRRSGWRTPTPP